LSNLAEALGDEGSRLKTTKRRSRPKQGRRSLKKTSCASPVGENNLVRPAHQFWFGSKWIGELNQRGRRWKINAPRLRGLGGLQSALAGNRGENWEKRPKREKLVQD